MAVPEAPTKLSTTEPERRRMSYEEFLAWAGEDTRAEMDKFDEYEANGVREYWIVDNRPECRRVEFYQLNSQNQYQQVAVGEDGMVAHHSAVLPGFWLKVEWLLADDPNWLAALGQIVGPDRLVDAIRSESKKG